MQEYLGLDGPAAGFMLRENLHPAEATLPFAVARAIPAPSANSRSASPATFPPAPATSTAPRAAVGDLFAAMEIVENRYGPPPAGDLEAVGTPTLIADQVYHRAAVLGAPPADWRALDLPVDPRPHHRRRRRARRAATAPTCSAIRSPRWPGSPPPRPRRAFGGLRAGQVVMLGSVTPPIWLDGPCTVTVHFDGLSEVRLRLT